MTKEEIQQGYHEHCKVNTNAPKLMQSPAFYTHDGWMQGAAWAMKEQQKIDIDKACECFRQELKHFVRMLECLKEGSSEIIDIEGSIDSFRKAMEE